MLLFSTLIAASSALAQADFEALRSLPVDYTPFGAICEQVARLRLARTYPAPQYAIETGLEYREGLRTVGELDVVVFQGAQRRAVLVAEVKCRVDLPHAATEARAQLARFASNIAEGRDIRFVLKSDPGRRFVRAQFTGPLTYTRISQAGGELAGFDRGIGLSLDEVTALRERLMACQSAGKCAQP